MTPEEKRKWDDRFKELTKHEVAFLKEQDIPINEYGAYVFVSTCGSTRIALDLFLASYKSWLIENDIIEEV